jgi:WD40 repeat protein
MSLQAVNLHDKKINTLHLEPLSERELASSCSDGSIAVWDVRKLAAANGDAVQPTATAGHSFTCQAAYFAPDGTGAGFRNLILKPAPCQSLQPALGLSLPTRCGCNANR